MTPAQRRTHLLAWLLLAPLLVGAAVAIVLLAPDPVAPPPPVRGATP